MSAPALRYRRDGGEQADQKYAYYLSMEFLQGRALLNAVENLDMADEVRDALAKVSPHCRPRK